MNLKLEVINTGTELILGQVLNTNLGFMTQGLQALGVTCSRAIIVEDGEDIGDAFWDSMQRSDIVIVSGGLGPTSDDITREEISNRLNLQLDFDPKILKDIEAWLNQRGKSASALTKKQAYVPRGGIALENKNGTAPGIYICHKNSKNNTKHIFLLPGPPVELKPMFINYLLPMMEKIISNEKGVIEKRSILLIKSYGIAEPDVANKVESALEVAREKDIIVSIEPGYCTKEHYEVDIRFIVNYLNKDIIREIILNELGDNVVSENGDDLESIVVRLLEQQNKKISVVESCSGGLLASRITDVSGASNVLDLSFVTYANEAKNKFVNVRTELLEKFGAVSPEVATAMAEGCLKVSGADIAVSITGIAGPSGGSADKPVGTAYIALASIGEETQVVHILNPLERIRFKYTVTTKALDMVRRFLLGFKFDF